MHINRRRFNTILFGATFVCSMGFGPPYRIDATCCSFGASCLLVIDWLAYSVHCEHLVYIMTSVILSHSVLIDPCDLLLLRFHTLI